METENCLNIDDNCSVLENDCQQGPQENDSEDNEEKMDDENFDENDDIRSTEDMMKQCQEEMNQEVEDPDPETRKLIKHQQAMQLKWQKQSIKDQTLIETEYQKQKKGFKVQETDAFRLHKFNREEPVTISTPAKDKSPQGIERLLVGSNVIPTVEHYSANIPGILGFLRYQSLELDFRLNMEKTTSKIKQSETSKRTDIKRTLVGFNKVETHGFRLERKENFQIPLPINGNNFERNHSQISRENIYRKFKGPLYNEAGKICVDLTDKYIMLEQFKFQTQLETMKYQIGKVQAERIVQLKMHEQRQQQKQKAYLAQVAAEQQQQREGIRRLMEFQKKQQAIINQQRASVQVQNYNEHIQQVMVQNSQTSEQQYAIKNNKIKVYQPKIVSENNYQTTRQLQIAAMEPLALSEIPVIEKNLSKKSSTRNQDRYLTGGYYDAARTSSLMSHYTTDNTTNLPCINNGPRYLSSQSEQNKLTLPDLKNSMISRIPDTQKHQNHKYLDFSDHRKNSQLITTKNFDTPSSSIATGRVLKFAEGESFLCKFENVSKLLKPDAFSQAKTTQSSNFNTTQMRITRQLAQHEKLNNFRQPPRFSHIESQEVKIKLDNMKEHESLRKLLMQRFDK